MEARIEERLKREAEEKYPVVEIDSLRPLTHSQEVSVLFKNSSNLDRQTAYLAGATSRQPEIEELRKERDQLREANRWHTTNEVIPDSLSKVLVYDARFKTIELKHCTVEKFLRQGRTHWRPLPSPPENR